ncbi:MAG: hypothetical protein ACMUIM_06670 [bacterium]
MDRIITIIIILYIFKKFYEAFSGDQGEKRGSTPHPPLPGTQRPSPSTTAKDQTGHFPPVAPKGRQDIRQVLTEFKKAQEMDKERQGLQGIPRQRMTPIKAEREKTQAQEEGISVQKREPKGMHDKGPHSAPKVVSKDNREITDIISFDEPGLFLQGIILAEVLRPPVSRRKHLMPPYLRG